MKNNIISVEDVLDRNLFGNHHIRKNGRSLFLSNWTKSGIIKVGDIWNNVTKTWKTGIEIMNTLIDKRN